MNRLKPLFASLTGLVMIAGLPAAAVAMSPAVAEHRHSETQSMLHLYVGQAHLLNTGPLRRIAVGNGRVIQATSLDDRQVLVIPEAAGQSTLHLWPREGVERSYVVNVIPADVSRLLTEIRALLGDQPNLGSRVVGDKVVIEGHSVSEEQAVRIAEIGSRYPQIVNLVSKVGLEKMVEMDVRMIEVRRDALQNLGIRWAPTANGPAFGVVGDTYRGAAFSKGIAAGAAGTTVASAAAPFAASLGVAATFKSVLHMLVQNGEAVILAEPRLACKSGGSARFIAGGELPIPFSSGFGATSVAFKEYGVKFDISPVTGANGVIAAKVATEISAIDFEVQVNSIPGLTKRRAETEVNLRENETLVIAGLLSEETSRNVDRVPALGELPILGKLFRSRLFRDRQTELVVFVTPRLVSEDPHLARAHAIERRNQAQELRELLRMVD
jgi:Flp pilus assembly secretin CpaC